MTPMSGVMGVILWYLLGRCTKNGLKTALCYTVVPGGFLLVVFHPLNTLFFQDTPQHAIMVRMLSLSLSLSLSYLFI